MVMIKKEVDTGFPIPRTYGVAWQEDFGQKTICYPLVLHWIMRWLRDAWFLIAKPSEREWYTQEQIAYLEAKAFSRGWHEAQFKVLTILDKNLQKQTSDAIYDCLKSHEYELIPSSYGSVKKYHEPHR